MQTALQTAETTENTQTSGVSWRLEPMTSDLSPHFLFLSSSSWAGSLTSAHSLFCAQAPAALFHLHTHTHTHVFGWCVSSLLSCFTHSVTLHIRPDWDLRAAVDLYCVPLKVFPLSKTKTKDIIWVQSNWVQFQKKQKLINYFSLAHLIKLKSLSLYLLFIAM